MARSRIKTYKVSSESLISQRIEDFAQLVKFKLSLVVVITSVLAFALVAWDQMTLTSILILAFGGFFVTSAANVLNEVLEKDFDGLMKRTATRPIVKGRISVSAAVMIAGFSALIGITLLALFNPITALLGTLAMVIYAFIYTPMKRYSPAAVIVGAIPGAMPVMIGCTAFEGHISLIAYTLFSIQFLWQFPHFFSIGFLRFDEYENAGFNLIPKENGQVSRKIARLSFFYALALVVVCLIPGFFEMSSWIAAGLASGFSLIYVYYSWNFYKYFNRKSALQLMFSSFSYMLIVLTIFLIDKI
jgi:protoheme IX farnesyltransferase